MDSLFMGAYWAERKATRDECAHSLADFISAIAPLDPSLSRWFQKGRSAKDAANSIDPTPEAIAKLLKSNMRDTSKEAIVEIGFGFGSWNGSSAMLDATIGSFSPKVRNSVVLAYTQSPITNAAVWKRIAEAAIRCFEPESLVITNHAYIAQQGGGMPWLVGGWFTYSKHAGLIENSSFASSAM